MKPTLAIHLGLFLLLFTVARPAFAQASGCIAHRPHYIEGVFEVSYDSGCSGHDEPELDPVSSAPGSARNLTWTVVLPTDGSFPVSATGPTFWFGGTVTDPSSLFGKPSSSSSFIPMPWSPTARPRGDSC